jgi:hypothetical protein
MLWQWVWPSTLVTREKDECNEEMVLLLLTLWSALPPMSL